MAFGCIARHWKPMSTLCYAELAFWAHSQKSKKKWLLASSYLSVCPFAQNISVPTGWNFMIFDIWVFFENLSRKFKIHLNRAGKMGTLLEDQYIFIITSCSVLLRMRNGSDKSCRENQNTHFMFNNVVSKSCHLWDNVKNYCRAREAIGASMVHLYFMLDT